MTRALLGALLTLPLAGAYSMFALGIVVIYRASRVLNLAHGAMATVPAYVAYSLAQAGMPVAVALPLAVASGALLGVAVERLVLRPLREESQTTQTVGTVAILGVLIAIVVKIWGSAPLRAAPVFPEGHFDIGRSILQYGEVWLAVIAVIVAGGFTLLFRTTDLGLAMRAAAENRRAAVLMGISPDTTTAAAWAIGGALAAAAGVMLAGVTNLHPYTLSSQVLPAFVAALIGGLGSLPGALLGAAVVGLAQGLIASLGPLGEQPGSAQLALAIVALAVMAARGRRHAGVAELSAAVARVSAPMRRVARARRRSVWFWVAVALLVPFLLVWPWLPFPDSIRGDANLAALYFVIAVSLVMLTGWVGQISLAHASFVGLAAFVTGVLVREAGIPFPLNLPIAAGAAAGAAVVLGTVALRVRGLYLAVATLIFGWMTDAYLFKAPWLVGEGGSATIPGRVLGRPGAFPSFDLTDRRNYWYVVLAAAALAIAAAVNLRDSRTGRAFFAVRGSETAAASLGINVTRVKLLAFGLSGLLAGIAGNLIMVDQRTASPEQFSFNVSLFYLSMAVVGGLTRIGGALVSAALFAALTEVFFRVSALGGYLDLVSSGLLLVAVLISSAPARARLHAAWDGFAGRAALARLHALAARLAGSKPPAPQEEVHLPDARTWLGAAAAPSGGGPLLATEDVTVRFGGLVAAEAVSLDVRQGEIVGLIGPNGAGKTTVFNAVSGFVTPERGRVDLFGKDITALPVHERAALGLGRTFQVLQLFRGASVFDNLLVATHLHLRTGPLSHLFVTDRALAEEREARERVREVIALVGLEEVAEARAGDLPFGILRMVEVGRALVTDARLLMLDEPASGLDDRETDRLSHLLENIRNRLGVSLLVVEHDVRFVTGLSDRLYVMDQGRIIAEGPPERVRHDPAVIAAYLGEPVALGRS